MNVHQLQVFLAVADSGNFARGAQLLHLSQPTVSQHIAALESELGVQLMDRSRKGVTLTEAGKLLLRHARRLTAEMDAAHQAIERFLGMEGAHLRVGVSTIPATYLVPSALPGLFGKYPDIQLTLVQGDSRETLDRVASDDVELGVLGSRFEQRGFDYAPWGKDTIRLVVRQDHPWAKAGKISLSELCEEPLIQREAGSGTGKTLEKALGEAGLNKGSLRIRAEVGSTEALKASVLAGLGGGFLSTWAISAEVERGELATVEVDGLSIERSFYLVRRAGHTLSPAAVFLWDLLLAFGR